MNVHRQQRTITRLFVLLLITVSMVAVLLVGLAVFAFNADFRARTELEDYHLRSLTTINEMTARLAEARGDLLGPGASADEFSLADRRQLSNVASALAQNHAELAELQLDHPDERFAGAVERVGLHVGHLLEAAEHDGLTTDELVEEFDVLELSLFQLSRLHSIDVEEDLAEITVLDRLIVIALVVVVPLLFGAAFLIVRKLFALLRRRLREHEEAQNELLETQRQLEVSQRLDALGTLVGGVAHDFNNLLMVILLRVEVAQQRLAADDPAREDLREMKLAADLAADLTRQLLAFSRQEIGLRQPTDLGELIEGMEPLLRGLIRADMRLTIANDPDLRPVVVDQRQVQQVLMNLVVNARDAVTDGGRIKIRTENVEFDNELGTVPPGGYSRIRVSDNGVGMTEEVRMRALDPFFTTKERGEGTGLGLSTVHGIVTSSDGYLDIHSRPGVGTTIDVYLPHADVGPAAPASETPAAPTEESRTILLVEDEEQIRTLLGDELRRNGYIVVEAASGDAALKQDEVPLDALDLVLTDVVMPGIRGTVLVQRLRRLNPEIAVVYMSGYVEEEVLADVVSSGEAFLPKPFQVRDALNVVHQVLERRARVRRSSRIVT